MRSLLFLNTSAPSSRNLFCHIVGYLLAVHSQHSIRTAHYFIYFFFIGIAGLFTVFSSFIFTTAIIKFLGSDISDLK